MTYLRMMNQGGEQGPQGIPGTDGADGIPGADGAAGADGRIAGHVATVPPVGMLPITNMFWDPVAQKATFEYDDLGGSEAILLSTPPAGKNAITNVYFNPATGNLVSEYEDET